MDESSSLKKLMDETDCPVCMITLEDPVILSCGHSLCRKCAGDLVAQGQLKCPVDRQVQRVDRKENLTTNFLLAHLIEKLPFLKDTMEAEGQKFCKTCFSLVNEIDPMHQSHDCTEVSEGRKIVAAGEQKELQERLLFAEVCRELRKQSVQTSKILITKKIDLLAEVDAAAEESMSVIRKHREKLNNDVENLLGPDLSAAEGDIKLTQSAEDSILKYQPNEKSWLSERIKELKKAQQELQDSKLPVLHKQKEEVIGFEKIELKHTNFALGKVQRKSILTSRSNFPGEETISNYNVYKSPVFLGSYSVPSNLRDTCEQLILMDLSKVSPDGADVEFNPWPFLDSFVAKQANSSSLQECVFAFVVFRFGDRSSDSKPVEDHSVSVGGDMLVISDQCPQASKILCQVRGDFCFIHLKARYCTKQIVSLVSWKNAFKQALRRFNSRNEGPHESNGLLSSLENSVPSRLRNFLHL